MSSRSSDSAKAAKADAAAAAKVARDDAGHDPMRPSDHVDGTPQTEAAGGPRLGPVGWLRFAWRQLTSMRTAIVLLLMLALAAVPGSLVPQRSSDPNGVIAVRDANPDLVWLYDALQLHDVYTSPWFSAITILLLVSLVGCVIPRMRHHWAAMRARPPKTPARLSRLVGFQTVPGDASDVDRAEGVLRRLGYRTERYGDSVSAERGYLRETGNLIFHASIVVIVVAIVAGSGFGFQSQRLVVEGEGFSLSGASLDTLNTGQWVSADDLPGFGIHLDELDVVYETENVDAIGQPLDFTAFVQVTEDGDTHPGQIRINEPLRVQGSDLYLISNGYAPQITVTNADGTVVFDEIVPFLAQDNEMTSLGVIKLPDGLAEQVGLQGFFYPSAAQLDTGAYASYYPDLLNPLLSLQVYTGDLGLDDGVPQSVYQLDTEDMEQVAGRDSAEPALLIGPGETVDLPDGLGTISFEGIRRYAVIDVHRDVTQGWVLGGAIALVAGLLASLLIPRRRLWVKATEQGLELAGLARGEDPRLEGAVDDLARRLRGDDADDLPPKHRWGRATEPGRAADDDPK
ncbi:cytochrome c biogenesis protein ResB [Agrococcus jejuensis]|uniref:cytochrome c biogenesis protein ResB n=1 Tax=Agrococcus jejuensis TaxID=399736 RepID=UPI0021B66159|nr:cytochrome c biogenesis protein ResB [Agrococcus jejuensis]